MDRNLLNSSHYVLTHSVEFHHHGIRLDSFLKEHFYRRSREQLKRLIHDGDVSVKREQSPHLHFGRAKPSSQLLMGDEVFISIEKKPEPEVRLDYQVLYEDEALFVINKPPHLPVHPAGRYFFNTLLIHLKTQCNQNYFLSHRIDKETSGVMVLAKTKEVCANVTKQFADRTTQKKYLAIVNGICPETFSIDLALKRSTNSKIHLKMMLAPESEGGFASYTSFRRLQVLGTYSLVECFPKTGRQHQIRIHLESAGYPIVGDKLYGLPESEALHFLDHGYFTPESKAKLRLLRHALHASWIRLFHPLSGKEVEFSAPLPDDLQSFIDGEYKNA